MGVTFRWSYTPAFQRGSETKRLEITGLVTEHVKEIMLGVDFLTDHKAMWDFTSKKIWIDGVSYPLYARQSTKPWSRRVVLSGDVTVPAISVMDVSANVIFDSSTLRKPRQSDGNTNVWSVDSHPVQNGVMVARSLLPDRAKDVPLQLMNLRDRPVKLRKHTVVGDLERLHAFSTRTTLPQQEAPADEEERALVDEMMSKVDSSVPDDIRARLRKLLEQNISVFSKNKLDLGYTDLVSHSIDTGKARPIRQQLRRCPPAHKEVINKHLSDMLQQKVIEPSSSPWASNIVLAKKADGSLRCCIDYRALNEVTVKDAYPLPRQDVCRDALSGSCYFTSVECRSGFHQVAIKDPASAAKTAFVTHRGLFQFRSMPFGLCNAVATFQRLVDIVLSGMGLDVCLAYLDDVCSHSVTLEQHLERLEVLFQKLKAVNLKLKPSKCFFMQTSIKF